MSVLEILIEENTQGGVRPVEVVADAPVSALVPALVEELRLPQSDLYGNPLVYMLRYTSGGQVLPENRSLAQSGVQPGARLALDSYAMNGTVATMIHDPGIHAPTTFHSDMTIADQNGFSVPVNSQNASGALPPAKKERHWTRRAFLLFGGAALGAGTLGVGYAAYRSFSNGSPKVTNPPPTAHMGPAATTQPQQMASALPKMAQKQFVFMQHQQTVRSVTWSPDGTMLASGSNDAKLLIWNTTGTVQQTLQGAGPVRALAWSPAGQQLAAGTANQVVFFNPLTAAVLARSTHRHTAPVTSLAWSPQAPLRLLSTGMDKQAVVWDGMTHHTLRIFAGHTSPVDSGSWANDGQTVATASTGGVIRVWNATSLQEVHGYYQDAQIPMQSLAFAPAGTMLAVGGDDGIVRLWNGTTCQQQAQTQFGLRCMDMPQHLRVHTQAVRVVAWSPDARFLATGGEDGLLAIWYPAQSHKPLFTVQHNAPVRALHWSPTGQQVATASGNTVTIWMLK
ncbi:MAG: hypothetical protein M3Z08_10305 [Chloroflexota bacterium]|nr:hypothetical protein [Chloroflexota bacterium]